MCGHVGIAKTSALTLEEERAFTNLLFLDTIRGEDATGVCAVEAHNKSKASRLFKLAVAAPEFIQHPGYKKLLTKPNSVLIGHNRAATKGKVIDSNSHPFNFKHITLAHNGTLTNYSDLPGHGKYSVDSEVLAHAFADVDNPKEVLEAVVGAYAVVWYNQRDNTLSFARNNERPFSFAISEDKNGLMWASEQGMLVWALNRHAKNKWKVFELPTEKIHTFQLGEKTLAAPEVIDFKEKKYQTSYSSYQGGYAGGYGRHSGYGSSMPSLAEMGFNKGEKVYLVFEGATIQSNINGRTTYNCIFEDYDPTVKVGYKAFNIPAAIVEDEDNDDAVYEAEVSYVTQHKNNEYRVVVNNVTKLEIADINIRLPAPAGKDDEEEEMVKGPNGTMITIAAFRRLTMGGCVNCAAIIKAADAEDVMWVNEGEDPVCPDCAEVFSGMGGLTYGH